MIFKKVKCSLRSLPYRDKLCIQTKEMQRSQNRQSLYHKNRQMFGIMLNLILKAFRNSVLTMCVTS